MIEKAILETEGVVDLDTGSIQYRAASDSPFGFNAFKNVKPKASLYAGWSILEDTAQYNLDNNLLIQIV